MTYGLWKTIWWLFAVEYATLDSQAEYNAALTSDGFHQGGLGPGVTTLVQYTAAWSWAQYNQENPVVRCGYTDSLGNRTGIKSYTLMEADGVAGRTVEVALPWIGKPVRPHMVVA